MSITPAQGRSFGGISGLTSVKVSSSTADPTDSSNRLDASTLALPAGSNRAYVDGLPDPGQSAGEDGITITAQITFLGAGAPSVGDEVTEGGVTLVCTESEVEYAVGELVKGSATYATKPPDEGS
jgi:hypothetical protein